MSAVSARTAAVRGSVGFGTACLILLASLGAAYFVVDAALPYVLSSAYKAQQYAGRRDALMFHILFGTIALFTGPVQLWLGMADRRMQFHRKLGLVYMLSVAAGSVAAFVLVFSPGGNWVFRAGLFGLAVAWLTTTGMAFVAIKRNLVTQHKEWMIRSYVVTFAFVFFRFGTDVLNAARPGAGLAHAQTMAWACWAFPLLLTELTMQGRKVLAFRR